MPELIYALFFEKLAPFIREIGLRDSSYLNFWLQTLSSALLDKIDAIFQQQQSAVDAGKGKRALNHPSQALYILACLQSLTNYA